MTRRSVLYFVCTFYLGSIALFFLWGIYSWQRSSQLALIDTVQGASSQELTPLPTAPKLAPYPVLSTAGVYIPAQEYALYNVESGKFVLQSKSMPPVAIASTTKLMTAYVVLKHSKPDDIVTISEAAATQMPSTMGLYTGEHIKVIDLIYGMLLVSGNDAAYALSEFTGSSLNSSPALGKQAVDQFVREMNSTAAQLGLLQTHYRDPAGLLDGLSTATDLAKMMNIDLQIPLLQQIMSTANTTVYNTEHTTAHPLHNSDRLLVDAPYGTAKVLAGKTGYTEEAGHCIVVAAQKEGKTFIGVILHTDVFSNDASADAVRQLLDVAFTKVKWE